MNLGRWADIDREPFMLRGDVPGFAGISGGRTSAMMAAILDPRATLLFQNTGREHPVTYDFLRDLEQGLQRRIIWLEFRPAATKGAPPREFQFAEVTHETADRTGQPFAAMLQGLVDYRATKGLDPVAPWARSRICTAYLKHRIQEHYIRGRGIDTHDQFVGLRADEPERVHRLLDRDTQKTMHRCPLFTAGITKRDVGEFWAAQDFDLQIRGDYQGNCTGCFLKDQSDIARVLQEPETDAAWWIGVERKFNNFGGQNFPGYTQLLREAPLRRAIEAAIRAKKLLPDNDGSVNARRFKLVVAQERRRVEGAIPSFSCSCETAVTLAEADADAEERFILSLPA